MLIDKYGFDFDGNTMITPYINPIINTTNFSMYFEVKSEDLSQAELFTSNFGTGAGGAGINITYPASTQGQMIVSVFDGAPNTIGTNSLNVTMGDLHKVLYKVELDGGIPTINLFIDGVLVMSNTNPSFTTTNIPLVNANRDYWVGGLYNNPTIIRPTTAILANIAVYNEALTDQESINITNGLFDNTDNRIIYYESFDQITKGVIVGTEQYEIIEQIPAPIINGYLFEKKETITVSPILEDSSYNYEWLISNWVFGGEMTVTVNNSDTKTISTATYDVNEKRYFVIDKQTTTDSEITVNLPITEGRSMLIIVESDSTYSEISYTFSHTADILNNPDSITANALINDLYVNYATNKLVEKSVSVRVDKADVNLFRTIVQENIYFDNNEWIVMGNNFTEFDTTRYLFQLSLSRLL